MSTGIEWTDTVWNPVVGCARVSSGCEHCYAERMAARLATMPQAKARYEGLTRKTPSGPRWTGEVRTVPEVLKKPLGWRKPRRVFVNSMSDLFHDGVPFEYVAAVFGVMASTPRHTYQVLTKRPARMLEFFRWLDAEVARRLAEAPTREIGWSLSPLDHCVQMARRYDVPLDVLDGYRAPWPLPNVHLGVSVEDQRAADERIPLLLQAPAAVRWISAEPLLGPVDLERLTLVAPDPPYGPGAWLDALRGHVIGPDDLLDARLDWVVVGGESGPGARPMHPDWARQIRDQCAAAGTPFLFKQHGEWAPDCLCYTRRVHPTTPRPEPGKLGVMFRCGKARAGRLLDGALHDEYPEARHG